MKILTRYVLWSFLKNYVISALVLVGLYVVLDMVFNFDEIDEARRKIVDAAHQSGAGEASGLVSTVAFIFDYYFHHAFVFFVQLGGIIPVVAAAFTLLRMSRFNELTAVLAAGVPLLNVAAPILVCGVVLNIVLLPLTQEIVIPGMIPKLAMKYDEAASGASKLPSVNAMEDDKRSILHASAFYAPTKNDAAKMQIVDIIERDESLQVAAHIKADQAIWEPRDSSWLLINGFRETGLAVNQVKSPEKSVRRWYTSISPQDIALYLRTASRSGSGDYVDLLSTGTINELLQRPKIYGQAALLKVKHFRWSQLALNIVLLGLAIPCVLTREPGALKRSASKCLILVGLCMGVTFIAQGIASTPPSQELARQWPLICAWVPLFIFLPVSLVLLDRVKT